MRSKDVNKLIEYLNVTINKKDNCAMVDDKIILLNNIPSFFLCEGKWVPTLKYLIEHDILKKIVVDMGAIKFVIKGADIMRPGITKIDLDIKENEPILIVDETHGKTIAVGIALCDGTTMDQKDSGKVVKNVHYVGDEIWRMD